MIAFWQKGGKNRTDCVFLDKFIFHNLIAFLDTDGKNRTVLSFEGRYSKRKGAMVGAQNFLFRYFEQVGPVCIELFNQNAKCAVLACKSVWFCFLYDKKTSLRG